MDVSITPASSLNGAVRLPGDKSISHRYGMLSAIAEGPSTLHNYSTGADCHSTLNCMESLGITITRDGTDITVQGQGLHGLKEFAGTLDAGNSGSTIRMLSGILAGQQFTSRIEGDESLARRPMARIMKPLAEMGAVISARDSSYTPLVIQGRKLKAIDYTSPVASAQVKSCILFAALYADGVTTVRESIKTRDHSEIALEGFGAEIKVIGKNVSITGGKSLTGRELTIPGDLSSAAFFLVAATMAKQARVLITGVGLNPTRSALLDFLVGGGANIKIQDIRSDGGELTGDLLVQNAKFQGGFVDRDLAAALIDELPVLAVLAATSENGMTVRDAAELRVKETDRIATVAENMRRMGIEISTFEDGFHVPGKQQFQGAEVESFGDHRIAMAFAVAGLSATGQTTVKEAEAASVSFPEFYNLLNHLRG